MITLYHCIDARSFRVLWALEELRLPYELVILPFPPRAFDKSYFAVNPLGTVPTLLDDGIRMTESAAACHYLAAKSGSALSVAPHEPGFADFLNWTHFGEATLTFPQTLVLRYGALEPPTRRSPQVVDDYRRWFLGRLRLVEAALLDRQFLCAGRFTVADICVGYALLLAQSLSIDEAFTPSITAYWTALQMRDAFIRAKSAQRTSP